MRTAIALVAVLSTSLATQEPPAVTSMTPASGAADVDAGTVTQLVVVFDRAMSQTGWSLCGGGPMFPNITARPTWKDGRTLVVEVRLEPDHQYSLSLNCPAATNFRSAVGVPLAPVPWSFATLPKELPDQKVQQRRNKAATAELQQTLAEHYSHLDLRVKSWSKLLKQHEPALLAAKTDRAWAAAAAHMLEACADLHLYLHSGDTAFATGRRAVDPLYRDNLIANYVHGHEAGAGVFCGRTDDGFGYLMIADWSQVDPDRIGGAITELMDTKGMVVDVRPNSGGDELLAQRVAAWFIEGRVVYAKNRYRTGKGKNAFGPVLERSLTGNGPDRRYDRPIAVLTSRYVMSSNESFVMMLQQAPDCTLVGQPTYGSSGNPKPFELANGVTIKVPSWQDLRLDGTCFEGEGIAPDIVVEPGDLKESDPILQRALEVLRAKIAK
jgi:Peptidase family S41